MNLQPLVTYYEQLEKENKVGSDEWSMAKVSYAITVDIEGKVKDILSLMRTETRGKKTVLVPIERKVPQQKVRTSGISPNFMCDNAKYLLGAWLEEGEEKKDNQLRNKAKQYFQASANYHIGLLEKIESPAAKSVCNFFRTWDFDRDKEIVTDSGSSIEELLSATNLVFRSFETGKALQEDEEIIKAWIQHFHEGISEVTGRCLITGKIAPMARLHPLIKGVRGAQASGAMLVSFNAAAFESYNKIRGTNAPVSEYAAGAYGKALNYLLGIKNFHQVIGDTTIVYWSESGEEGYADMFAELCEEQEEEDQDKIWKNVSDIAKGIPCQYKEIDINPETKFYILGLAPNAARLSIRFFYQNSFGEVVHNIGEHYKRMEIKKPSYVKERYVPIEKVLFETVNKKSSKKEIQPILVGGFMNSVLNNTRYPETIFTNIIIRIRADKDINYRRVGMLKAFFIKNKPKFKEVVDTMELNENTNNMPYLLGRLFEVLEHIQHETYRDINTTIKDQFFVSACATPMLVFPRLLKLSNSHMRVLKREKPGMYYSLTKQLEALMGKFTESFPKQLSIEEQGIFIIGYYHQLQKRFEKKEEKITNKQEEQVNE